MNEHEYWKWMREKAAHELAVITKRPEPEDEGGVKHRLARILLHGDCDEKAAALVESMEWTFANLMCKFHAHKEGMPIDRSAHPPMMK